MIVANEVDQQVSVKQPEHFGMDKSIAIII